MPATSAFLHYRAILGSLRKNWESCYFNRDNRSVTLTTEGQSFQRYAKDATAQWELICNELTDNASDQLRGKVSMYCSVTASYSILFDLLNRFRQDYPPALRSKLHTGDPEHAIARILAGEEDITIAAHPRTLPRGLVFKHGHGFHHCSLLLHRLQSDPDVPMTLPTSPHPVG